MHRALSLLLATALLSVGCIGSEPGETDQDPLTPAAVEVPTTDTIRVEIPETPSMAFTTSVVDAAIGYTNDLYEPTMEVSDTGAIYVTGHTVLVDTTGAPVFMSTDEGESWEQLPFFMDAQMPAGIHGATPPPSDEIFLVAGDDGQLWGVDITLLTFPVNGWCNDGAQHCYHNPNAYDEAQAQTTRAQAAAGLAGAGDASCSPANLNDRPWAAYANDTLLMVNNPGGGPVQVGAMAVPPSTYVGGPGLGVEQAEPLSAEWNLCAGEGSGSIPGIPDMREDGFFAVPQVQDDQLVLVTGNARDVMDVGQVTLFEVEHASTSSIINSGQVVFDQDGTLFAGIMANTEEGVDDGDQGQLKIGVSTDDGATFLERTLQFDTPIESFYMDGNMHGPGALLTWAQTGESETDWYAAHLQLDEHGDLVLENASLMLDEGPPPSAHVQGAAAGPDGRAHMVMFHSGYTPADQATPLEVLIQQDGPTLPAAGS